MIALASIAWIGVSPAIAGILGVGEVLQRGDSGPKVGALQRQLLELGLYSGTVTEFYGPQTEAAISAYQQSLGLRADGIFGIQTDSALFDGVLLQSTTPTTGQVTTSGDRIFSLGERVVELGDQGSDVREIQTLLNRFNRFSPLTIDGAFGSNTQAVVTDFQQQYGLRADGKVGPTTLNALLNPPVNPTTGLTTFRSIPIQSTPSGFTTSSTRNISLPANANQATINANQINNGPYTVVIPADSDDLAKLSWVRGTDRRACMTRSRRGSYIFAGSYQDYSSAESRRLELRANRLENSARTDARVDYRNGDLTVECIR